MLRAQGDGLHNPVVDPFILIWNLEGWLEFKRIKHYRYIFDNLRFEDLFNLQAQFYIVKDVPFQDAVQINEAFREVAVQDAELMRIRHDVFDSAVLMPYKALENLLDFLLSHPRPFLGKIPWVYVQILERLLYVTLWIPVLFERIRCQSLAFELSKIVLVDVSFSCYNLTYMYNWTEYIRQNFLPRN